MNRMNCSPEAIERLTQSLEHEDSSVRFNAGLDLVRLGDSRGIPALIEVFEYGTKAMRLFYASQALVELGTLAIPYLTDALASPNSQVRLDAAYTLYHIDNGRLSELLPFGIRAFESNDPDVIEDALQFFSEVNPQALIEIVPALSQFLQSPFKPKDPEDWYSDLRASAAVLLAQIGEPMEEIENTLIDALSHPAVSVRWGTSCALGEFGPAVQRAMPYLAAIVRDEAEVETIRVMAAYALAAIGDPITDTAPVLLDILRSDDWWMRVYAARILGEMVSASSMEQASENFPPLMRVLMGVWHIQHLNDPTQVVPALIDTLSDSDYNVRRNVAWALSKIGKQAKKAIPSLTEALKLEDVGPIVAETLSEIGEDAIPKLISILDSNDELWRCHAAYALSLIDSQEAQNTIEKASRVRPIDHLGFSPSRFYVPVPVKMTPEKKERFEDLYQETLKQGTGNEVNYILPYPKHEFLQYLVEDKGLMMHGSDNPDIDSLKPLRQGIDASEHGNVSGVYADPDPIRPIYFAVVNGRRSHGNTNSFIDVTEEGLSFNQGSKNLSQRVYKLAVGAHGLRRDFWQSGMMYILPKDTFEYWNEWTSRGPVRPLMKLALEPDDLPLKDEIWGLSWRHPGHWWVTDNDRLPFLKEVQGTPIHPSGRPIRQVKAAQ